MPQQVKKTLVISIYFALTISALLVFWQTRNFDFVNYDDNTYVSENPHVLNGLTFDNIIWAFTAGHAGNWHPLTWLSLMLDCQLFGTNAGWMHLVNLLLHLANTLLLFTVLTSASSVEPKKMTSALWPSAFVAAAFALHPMHVESVAWITERKDVLSTFFWLLAMLVYVRYIKQPTAARYLLVLLIFAFGLMAKSMLVTLPFVFLLLDYWPLNRINGFNWKIIYRLILEKIPFIFLSAVSSVITFLVQRKSGAMPGININGLPLKARTVNAFLSYARYIGEMFWPQNMAVFYPFDAGSFAFRQVAMCVLLLLVMSIFVIRFGRNQKYLPVGWFWFVGTLVPVIGFVQVGSQAYADRYTYVPYIGLFIMLAWGLPELLAKLLSASPVESPQRKIALGLSMVIVLTTLGICAHRQTSYWKNSFTLFSHALAVTQNNYVAYGNLGVAYVNLNSYNKAIDAYQQAIKINPEYAFAYHALGVACAKLSRYQDAIESYKQAIRIKPDEADAHYNLGNSYAKLGRWPEAIDAYKQAIRIQPDLADVYRNLGNAYARLGRYQDAIEFYKQAIRRKPDDAEAEFDLGNACYALGRRPEAIETFRQAIGIKPDYAEAYYNLGIAYDDLGRYAEAIDAYKQAVRIKPDDDEAHCRLGAAYLAIGDKNSALAEYNILKSLNSELANKLLKEINK